MSSIEQRIQELGYRLPAPSSPAGNYVPARESGGIVCVSGQLPMREGELIHCGKVDSEITIERAREAAQAALLCGLAALYNYLEDLKRIEQFLQLRGYVNADAHFTEHSKVIDGASNMLVAIFGTRGEHARAAVGVASLPRNASVEIELMVRVLA